MKEESYETFDDKYLFCKSENIGYQFSLPKDGFIAIVSVLQSRLSMYLFLRKLGQPSIVGLRT